MTVLDLMTMLAQCPLSAEIAVVLNHDTQTSYLIVAPKPDRYNYHLKGVYSELRGGKRVILWP